MPDAAIIISQLWIYPVKSCRGIRLTRARLTPWGFEHDRSWMVVDPDGRFLTQRRYPRMALIVPAIGDDELSIDAPQMPTLRLPLSIDTYRERGARTIRIWVDDLAALDAGDAASRWFSDYLGTPVRLVRFDPDIRRIVNRQWTGDADEFVTQFADGFPILVTGEASLEDLNRRLRQRGHAPVPMTRFRPNLVLAGTAAYEEDRIAVLGSADGAVQLRLVKPCARCPIPTIDQDRGVRHPDREPLETLKTYRVDPQVNGGVTFGRNAVVAKGVSAFMEAGRDIQTQIRV